MNQAIVSAIQTRSMIEFNYNGHNRIAEPHIYGRHNGTEQVLGYQVAGGSSSGGLPEWRRFDIPKMSNLRVLEEVFAGPRPSETGEHSHWDTTFAIVK